MNVRHLLVAVACLVLALALAGCAEGPSGSLRSGGSQFVGDWNTTMQMPNHAELAIILPEGLAGSTASVYAHLESAQRHPAPTPADGDAVCIVVFFHGATRLIQASLSDDVSPVPGPPEAWEDGSIVNTTMPSEPYAVHLGTDYARDIRATVDCTYDVQAGGSYQVITTFGPLIVTWGN